MPKQDEPADMSDAASRDADAQDESVSVDQTQGEKSKQEDPPTDPLEALEAQCHEMEARLLRVSADYQNYVRRSTQNTENACQHQLLQMTKVLLTPLDHFDHALAVDPAKTSSASLIQGVQMVRDELAKVLEQFEIKRMQVNVGDPFDPMCHEAIQRMAVDGLESGVIAEQVQPGYLLGDKIVRPAKVVVAE